MMPIRQVIRQLKKLEYKHGTIECISPIPGSDSFAPLEWDVIPEEMHGDIKIPPRLVFGPHGTKAAMARRARQAEEAAEKQSRKKKKKEKKKNADETASHEDLPELSE